MATIREISDKANVSTATVSKVLNGKSGVNKTTAEHVLSVARELNYRPNLNARFLKTGSSRTLGIITEDLTVFNAPEIVDGIAATCEQNDYHYILGNLRFDKRFGNVPRNDPEKTTLVHDMVDNMLSKQVDGIIYIGCHSHAVVSLSEHDEPKFVCAYCFSSDKRIPSVLYDDKKAAYQATELLLRGGDTCIGMITGIPNSVHTLNRTRGFQEALFDKGVPYNPQMTVVGDWDRDCGYTLAKELISAGATAIFAQNDLMAAGVIDYCNANGIEIGDELRLIGFDNREIASVCRPTLSTVELPLFQIGRTSARVMFELISGKELPQDGGILLDCTIIERGSTGVCK